MAATLKPEVYNPLRETFYDYRTEESKLDALLKRGLPYFTFYGLVIPAVAAVGIVQGVVCFCAFQHRDLRSICTMILNALFISDIMHLLCLVLLQTPTAWLVHSYNSIQDEGFWDSMDVVQRIYTGVYPISHIAQCLVFAYTVAVIMEQYCVFFHPLKLYNWSTRDSTIKMIITLMNITILIHLMHFFKFVRVPTLYDENPHNRICLSEIYRSDDYQALDQYVYYIVFAIIPWVISLFGEMMIVYGKIRSRREALTADWPNPDGRLLRVFKSGRSTKTVLLVGALFLICCGGVCVTQGLTVATPVYVPLSANCLDVPLDAQFISYDPRIELLYYAFQLLNSSCRLLLCAVANRDFRNVLHAFFARHRERCRRVMRTIKIFCACRPTGRGTPAPPKEPRPPREHSPSTGDYARVYVIPPTSEGRYGEPRGAYI